MAVYRVGGNSVARIDASAGGTLNALTQYVNTIEVPIEYIQLDTTHFDDASETVIAGIQQATQVTLRGAFDDAATTGPDAIFSTAVGTALSFEYNPRGTAAGARKINFEALVTRYVISGEVKGLLMYEAVLTKDGSATVGTN